MLIKIISIVVILVNIMLIVANVFDLFGVFDQKNKNIKLDIFDIIVGLFTILICSKVLLL